MRNRISVMIESRTRMLRGISHDLRTPLTRLRMRAERLSDGSSRDAMLSDIDRLNRLLTESLDYLRDNHRREATERTDLASLVKTVCTEFADIGFNVEYRGPNRLIVHCPPLLWQEQSQTSVTTPPNLASRFWSSCARVAMA